MAVLGACTQCGGDVTSDSDFCPHCGYLFEIAGNQECGLHSDRRARGVCIICHSTVCRECSKVVLGKMFCTEHKNVEVVQDWANVFQSAEPHEAELAKSILDSCGIKVHLQNSESIGFIWGAGSESAVSRSQINKPVKVFVPIPEYLKAVRHLEDWESAQESDADASEDPND